MAEMSHFFVFMDNFYYICAKTTLCMKKIKDLLLYLWQLPQNILGLVLIAFYKSEKKLIASNGNYVYFSRYMSGGISLGMYSIIDLDYYMHLAKNDDAKALDLDVTKHEALGHGTQSRILGPFYLLVIGLPSIIWASLYGTKLFPYTKNGYYKFYTEKLADKLGGVIRDE